MVRSGSPSTHPNIERHLNVSRKPLYVSGQQKKVDKNNDGEEKTNIILRYKLQDKINLKRTKKKEYS